MLAESKVNALSVAVDTTVAIIDALSDPKYSADDIVDMLRYNEGKMRKAQRIVNSLKKG